MKQFYKHVDLRSRKAMEHFLENHFRYNTMNSWNWSISYANNVKVYNLGLSREQESKLYSMMEVEEFYDQIHDDLMLFAMEHDYRWQVGFNGRSGGYLVLYRGFSKPSEYKSFCTQCGQRNFRSVEESGCKCGRCGAEAGVNYTKAPDEIGVYPGQSVDMDEDFNEWDIYSLRDRVRLIQEFDRRCDSVLTHIVEMLEMYDVVEETVMRPETVKALCEVAS